MAISTYPKPTDVIPYGEQDAKKSLKITNRINKIISIGQLNSTWEDVRFVLVDNKSDTTENTKWLADLEPGDTIQLFFKPPKPIEK